MKTKHRKVIGRLIVLGLLNMLSLSGCSEGGIFARDNIAWPDEVISHSTVPIRRFSSCDEVKSAVAESFTIQGRD